MTMQPILHSLLKLKRPSGGKGVLLTQQLICDEIEKSGHIGVIDEYGNIICTTKHTGVLFSCHTDTMHEGDGLNEIRVDEFGIVTAWSKTPKRSFSGMSKQKPKQTGELQRDVLGADDGAGIYIMLRMIEAGIHGTYVFHADEEVGCVGSKALADGEFSIDGFDLLTDFTHAIAFDRKGTSDFINNQLSEQMCSFTFQHELINRLNTGTILCYRPTTGLVTDTAMYADFVEECINLSVGYYDEHTVDERLDLVHLETLLGVILDRQDMFENLPVERELPDYDITEPAYWDHPESVEGVCRWYPAAVAELLKSQGYDYSELFSQLNRMDVI